MSGRIFGDHADAIRDTELQVLLLAGITAPLSVSLISPLFDILIEPFGATPSTIGLLVSAYTAPALFVIPLGGVLSDRYGRKPVLIAGLVLFGFAGTAIAAVSEFRTVLALRVLQGVGSAGISPIVITSIGDLYSDAEAATGQGLRIGAVGGAQTVFPPLAAALAIFAWQFSFLLYGMAIPIAFVVYRYFEEPSVDDYDTAGDRSYFRQLFLLAIRPRVFPVLVAYAGPVFLYFGFQAYVSVHVVRILDGTPRGASVVVALFSIVYAVAATQTGRIAERFAGRYRPLVGSNIVMTAGLAGFAFAPTFPASVLAGAVFGAGYGLTSSFYRSVLPEFAPSSLRGGLVSAAETLGRAGATIAPIVVGALIGLLGPIMGFNDAIRWAIFGIGGAAGLLGVIAVSIAAWFEGRS
jgi:MFS family permease